MQAESKPEPDGVMGDGLDESVRQGIAQAIAKSRVTKPLPNSRRPTAGVDFVPKQATVPKSTAEKENTRRLIVVLSQVRRGFTPSETYYGELGLIWCTDSV